jgi:hypothetical protein
MITKAKHSDRAITFVALEGDIVSEPGTNVKMLSIHCAYAPRHTALGIEMLSDHLALGRVWQVDLVVEHIDDRVSELVNDCATSTVAAAKE